MIDLALLAPDLTERDVAEGCETAKRYGIGWVTLRPADVQTAVEFLKGSEVVPVAAVSYPHGAATTAVKNYETRDMLQRGAKSVETPLNMGKFRSRNFQYVEMELIQIVTECRRAGATVTLDIEFPSLAQDLRVIVSKIAKRTEVDRVRAVSLFGTGRPSAEDLRFLREKLGSYAALDAGGWVRSLDDAKAAFEAGAASFQTTEAGAILDAWRDELQRREQTPAT